MINQSDQILADQKIKVLQNTSTESSLLLPKNDQSLEESPSAHIQVSKNRMLQVQPVLKNHSYLNNKKLNIQDEAPGGDPIIVSETIKIDKPRKTIEDIMAQCNEENFVQNSLNNYQLKLAAQ